MCSTTKMNQKKSNADLTRRLGMFATAAFIGIAGVMTAAPMFGQTTVLSPGNLVVSRSVYQGTASTVTIGETLPPVCGTAATCTSKATDTGAFPANGVTNPSTGNLQNVFNNNLADGSFGVTSPVFLDQMTTTGTYINTVPINPTQLVTSFSSKSELALNLSTDGTAITFVGYTLGPGNATSLVNNLDVSNSNTPGVVDPTNPVGSSFYRGVAQLSATAALTITDSNAYSGNNGRAAILANGLYYAVGNNNNGSASPIPASIFDSTGAEIVTPNAQPGTPVMIDPTLVTHAGDKAGKDSNFRGVTISPSGTLYVTKGSGSNGINTVYQVGTIGTLPTVATATSTAITIPNGFPIALAKTAGIGNIYPFGIWFANATTLYVGDEGDGVSADAGTSTLAGLQKWIFNGASWQMAYVMQNGLNLGLQYGVPSYPASLNPAPAGLRNITGRVNADGTATIWALTSTVSSNGDQGADPNQLVTITDVVANTNPTVGGYERFTLLETAPYATVLRGVAFTPLVSTGAIDAAIHLQISNTSLAYPGETNTTVCVSPATNTSATGVIQILDGTTILTTQPLEGNSCANWYISPGLNAGTHSLTAFYSGDVNNPSGTSAAVTVTVSPTPAYLDASCGNSSFSYGGNYGCNITVGSNAGSAQGAVTYAFDANPPVILPLTNGVAQFSLTTPNAGSHTVVIGYAQQGNFSAAGPSTQNFTVTQALTQVSLTPSNYYPAAGSAFTLSAAVTSYSAGPPASGLVTFFDNGSSIGTGTVNAQGQTSLTIPSLAAGYHTYTAQFSGVVNFAAGTSGTVGISAH